VRNERGVLNTHFAPWQPMGIAADGTRLTVRAPTPCGEYRNVPAVARTLTADARRLLCPRRLHVTGVSTHERPMTSTSSGWSIPASAACTLDADHSFPAGGPRLSARWHQTAVISTGSGWWTDAPVCHRLR
jgi:hypothetical protein